MLDRMRVLHLASSDSQGGGSRAALRLHQSLRTLGIDSSMLVQARQTDDATVFTAASAFDRIRWRLNATMDTLPVRLYSRRVRSPFSAAIAPFPAIDRWIRRLDPDVIHLHWINNGMLALSQLLNIKKPLVWTHHDSWAFTGGCHIPGECTRFQTGCGSCPLLGSASDADLSRYLYKRKESIFQRIQGLHCIGLSRWMSARIADSSLLGKFPVSTIPNPFDFDSFKALSRSVSRTLLGLPQGPPIALFIAASGVADRNKGFDLLRAALPALQNAPIELAIVGPTPPGWTPKVDCKVHNLGVFADDLSIRAAFSAADVLVLPSRQETLATVAIEAMACGTPVVAFATGGLPDIVDHNANGYLARCFDPADLAHGIEWVLSHRSPKELRKKARKACVQKFDHRRVARRYAELYQEVVQSGHPKEKTTSAEP